MCLSTSTLPKIPLRAPETPAFLRPCLWDSIGQTQPSCPSGARKASVHSPPTQDSWHNLPQASFQSEAWVYYGAPSAELTLGTGPCWLPHLALSWERWPEGGAPSIFILLLSSESCFKRAEPWNPLAFVCRHLRLHITRHGGCPGQQA